MAEPTTIDLKYTRTNTALIQFTLVDSAGAPVVITGFSFSLGVNEEADASGDQIMTVAGVVDDGPLGKFSFAPIVADTTKEPERYRYDVKMADAGPKDTTIIRGVFELLPNIS